MADRHACSRCSRYSIRHFEERSLRDEHLRVRGRHLCVSRQVQAVGLFSARQNLGSIRFGCAKGGQVAGELRGGARLQRELQSRHLGLGRRLLRARRRDAASVPIEQWNTDARLDGAFPADWLSRASPRSRLYALPPRRNRSGYVSRLARAVTARVRSSSARAARSSGLCSRSARTTCSRSSSGMAASMRAGERTGRDSRTPVSAASCCATANSSFLDRFN